MIDLHCWGMPFMSLYHTARTALEANATMREANEYKPDVTVKVFNDFAREAGINMNTAFGVLVAVTCTRLIVRAVEELRETSDKGL